MPEYALKIWKYRLTAFRLAFQIFYLYQPEAKTSEVGGMYLVLF